MCKDSSLKDVSWKIDTALTEIKIQVVRFEQ